jgi:large subunit ribosomal protein L5
MAEEKKTKGAKSPAKGGGAAKPSAPKAAKPAKPAKGGAAGELSPRGAVTEKRPTGPKEKPRLARHYEETVRPELMKKFDYKNVMQAPRVVKIVVNMGVGDALQDSKLLDAAMNELGQVTGQRASLRKAKKSISNFKLREGVPIGCAVTLRGSRMYEFYDRLINVAVPRIRDFRGLNPRSFDGRGNYNMGIREQVIFPEIDYDAVDQVRGLDVAITTTAATDAEAFALLEALGLPFSRDGRPAGFESLTPEPVAA